MKGELPMKAALWIMLSACVMTGMAWHPAYAGSKSACDKGQISREGSCEDPTPKLSAEEKLQSQAVPAPSCRAGYFQVGPRLCMTGAQAANTFANAMAICEAKFGRVADYGDWRYRRLFGDGIAAPVGWWLGPITADNRALFVNLPNTGDFDGETSRFDSRSYACAHDDSL
jgi:hypothetical protein